MILPAELPLYTEAFTTIQEQYPEQGADNWEQGKISHGQGRVFFTLHFTNLEDMFSMGMMVERFRNRHNYS